MFVPVDPGFVLQLTVPTANKELFSQVCAWGSEAVLAKPFPLRILFRAWNDFSSTYSVYHLVSHYIRII